MGTMYRRVFAFSHHSSSKQILDFLVGCLSYVDVDVARTLHIGGSDICFFVHFYLDERNIDFVSWFEFFSEHITEFMDEFLLELLAVFFDVYVFLILFNVIHVLGFLHSDVDSVLGLPLVLQGLLSAEDPVD